MSKNYNPEMPSTGYDVADLAALKASNLMPALKEDRLCRFDSTDDASIFFARELDYIKSKSYDKIYPEFTALNKFPITHEVAGRCRVHDILLIRENWYGCNHQQLCNRPSSSRC